MDVPERGASSEVLPRLDANDTLSDAAAAAAAARMSRSLPAAQAVLPARSTHSLLSDLFRSAGSSGGSSGGALSPPPSRGAGPVAAAAVRPLSTAALPEVRVPIDSALEIVEASSMGEHCEISQCGHILDATNGGSVLSERDRRIFDAHKVSFEAFVRNPQVLYAADVVYRIGDRIYPYQEAIPFLISMHIFGRSVHASQISGGLGGTPPRANAASSVSSGGQRAAPLSAPQPTPLPAEAESAKGAVDALLSSINAMNQPPVLAGSERGAVSDSEAAELAEHTSEAIAGPGGASAPRRTGWERLMFWRGGKAAGTVSPSDLEAGAGGAQAADAAGARSPAKAGAAPAAAPAAARSGAAVASAPPATASAAAGPNVSVPAPALHRDGRRDSFSGARAFSERHYARKTLRLTSDELAKLPLKPGRNTCVFSASSRMQGVRTLACSIYLWDEHAKIVVSDIDGTITRSDVLGQLMPWIGRDWSHMGVADLLANIHKNGYQVLYLSARAIGQATVTRDYIEQLKQGGVSMPGGPVLMSPDGLFESFKREVITRRPDEFKIACLRDVLSLFPRDWNPFYAGFGNRETDTLAYRALGIPMGKIFIISKTGELKAFQTTFQSYSSINELLNHIFPVHSSDFYDEKFNTWNYWRTPLPDV